MAIRTLRILATAGALDPIATLLQGDEVALDPVLVDGEEQVLWRGARCPIADAAPEIGWFSPELFRAGIASHFLALAAGAPSLGWMQSARAGFNDPGLAPLVERGVRLTTSDGPAVAMAEYALAQVLDHYQRGPERRAAQAEALWRPLPFRELGGTSWLLFGFGSVGREIAARARPFGARITGVRRSGGTDPFADRIVTPAEADAALAEADVLILSLPLSRETENMADAAFLARLKPGALFINVGRGALVDEEALRAALDGGRPGHAVLDVTRTEPLPPESWMWRHPGITLTPHVSGLGKGTFARTLALFADNLRRFARGEPLRNEVRAADVMASAGLDGAPAASGSNRGG